MYTRVSVHKQILQNYITKQTTPTNSTYKNITSATKTSHRKLNNVMYVCFTESNINIPIAHRNNNTIPLHTAKQSCKTTRTI